MLINPPTKTREGLGRWAAKMLVKMVAGDSFDEKHFAAQHAELTALSKDARELSEAAEDLGVQIKTMRREVQNALESRETAHPS